MNALPAPDLSYLLYRASESPIGLAVRTNNPQLLRNKLYALRKQLGLTNLTFIQPPVGSDTCLWIIKKDAKTDGPTED
jgi:hypothetical protein